VTRPALVLAVALAAVTPPHVAHGQATTPASDASRQVFSDIFLGQPAPPAFVVLSEGLVYRVEIEPATAQISIRVARRMSMPPLFLVPLSDASGPAQGAAYLLVPRASDEYRLDVSTDGDGPVRVRIFADSSENARWARMREASRDQRPAGISLRAVYFGAFRSTPRSYTDTTSTADGWGVEACLALLPHSAWLKQAYGGCVVSVTIVRRARAAGNVVFFAMAPRVELLRSPAGIALSAGLHIGLGQTSTGTNVGLHYFIVGASAVAGFPVPWTRRHLVAECEAGVSSIRGSTNYRDPRTHVVPRVGAGLQYAF
jgi:hypothetical protein